MLKTTLVSATNRVLVWSMTFLMTVGLAACGGGSGNDATTRTSAVTVVAGADQAVTNGSNSLLASAALVQDYTYLSQFGTQGSANGQFFIQPSQLLAQNVAIDPTSHNIVVSDFGNYRIQIFNSAGVYLSQFGTFGSGTNQLADPQSVAVDPTSHNIVVTDRNAIKIFNSAGVYLSQFGTFGSGNGQFNDPESIAIDPTSHNIVVADALNSRIQIFNSTGVYLSQFGSAGSSGGQFFHPFGVAIDPTSHNIVVSDLATNRVQIFNSAGVYLSQFGSTGSGNGQFRGSAGIAIDPVSHNIIVAESLGNRVQIFNSAGVYLSQFGSAGSGDGQFNSPGGIAIDPVSHNIVVSDLHNNRVQIFTPNAERKVIGPAREPSLAADPLDPLHAVIGFNDLRTLHVTNCGWAETRDGGLSWSTGVLRLPPGFIPQGDPWVRFGPSGELFYSCLGATEFKAVGGNQFILEGTEGAFLAVARPSFGSVKGASASDFGEATPIRTTPRRCAVSLLSPLANLFGLCNEEGEFVDHPSITILNVSGRTRLVACLTQLTPISALSGFVTVTFSDDEGKIWSVPKAVGGPGVRNCTVGGSEGEVGVTWWDTVNGALNLRTSTDGKQWSNVIKLGVVGPLVNNQRGQPESTSTPVLSPPYALVLPGQSGLQAVWESRTFAANAYISQVYVGPAVNHSLAFGGLAFGDPTVEKFLPGTGRCGRIAGAYQATGPSGLFRYTVWSIDNQWRTRLIFTSGHDLDPTKGQNDPSHPGFRRIGDYTGVDCSGDSGWAAWTDLRNGGSEIWAARIPLPQ